MMSKLIAAVTFAALSALALAASHVLGERATIRGVVTFARGGDDFAFVITDAGTSARLGLAGGNRVYVGERVEATGDVTMAEPNFRMEDVVATRLGEVALPRYEPATVAELGDPSLRRCGVPVELTLRVLDVNRRRTQMQLYVCDLDARATGATASFPMKESELADEDLRRNAIVRVRAVPSMIYTPEGVTNLTLNILSAEDVEVLTRAPWWTPARKAVALAVALFAIVMLAGWVALLKRAARAEMRVREERLRLARDLHDEFQQQLAGTMFHLDAAASVVENPDAVARQIAGARKTLMNTQSGLRSILWGLQRAGREADTLAGLFRTAAARMPHWGGVVEIVSEGEPPIGIKRQGARLLMILQEAVGNALRHGGARHVAVKLLDDGRRFAMSVADDGCGFDPAAVRGESGHMGLSNMRTRADAIGGSFSVKSRPGEGTTVEVEIIHD
ncbi:MAG: sensor histidine kinase [Kiritimatiellae bacterium]|nr:sensor histidine kinase [Kiritimatiellia bacterium]